jgi:hypothetical protein
LILFFAIADAPVSIRNAPTSTCRISKWRSALIAAAFRAIPIPARAESPAGLAHACSSAVQNPNEAHTRKPQDEAGLAKELPQYASKALDATGAGRKHAKEIAALFQQ